jgi:hypothetical protein
VEAYASEFWSELPEHIKGEQDDKRPGEYHSVEFGTLYKGTVSRMLQDNFGVESRHTRQGSLLTFDCATIIKLQSQLNTKIRVSRDAVTPVTTYREGVLEVMMQILKIKQLTPHSRSRHTRHCRHKLLCRSAECVVLS